MEDIKKDIVSDVVYIVSASYRSFHGVKELMNKSVTYYNEFNTFEEAFDFYKNQFYDDCHSGISKRVGSLFYYLAENDRKNPVWKLRSTNYTTLGVVIRIPVLNKDQTKILYIDTEYITEEDLCKLIKDKYITGECKIPSYLDKDAVIFAPYVHEVTLTNRL